MHRERVDAVETKRHLPVGEPKTPGMPRTHDGQTLDPTFRQRTALVRARIVEGIKHSAGVEDGNFPPIDHDGRRGARRDIRNFGNGNEFDGHASELCEGKTHALLRDYRDWLKSELQILGNASHHAYSLGQANMAKRAIEQLDITLATALYFPLGKAEARRALTELELLDERDTALPPGLIALRDALRAAIVEAEPPSDEAV
jgi:hypothetical protein